MVSGRCYISAEVPAALSLLGYFFLGVISDAYCIMHLIGLTPIDIYIIPILISEEYSVMTFLLFRIYELAIWKFSVEGIGHLNWRESYYCVCYKRRNHLVLGNARSLAIIYQKHSKPSPRS